MKRILYLALALMLCAAVGACAEEARKVIIDTDTGADDASALILAASSPEIDILFLKELRCLQFPHPACRAGRF